MNQRWGCGEKRRPGTRESFDPNGAKRAGELAGTSRQARMRFAREGTLSIARLFEAVMTGWWVGAVKDLTGMPEMTPLREACDRPLDQWITP